MPKFRHRPRYDAIAYLTTHPTLFASERLIKGFSPAGEPCNLLL
jgi:hypothetical protein